MSEVEFDLLLDVVRTAVTPISEEDYLVQSSPRLQRPPRAANDNRGPWPLFPFSGGRVRPLTARHFFRPLIYQA